MKQFLIIGAMTVQGFAFNSWAQNSRDLSMQAIPVRQVMEGFSERAETSGQDTSEFIDATIQDVKDNYGYEVECSRGMLGLTGISKEDCRIGLQKISSLLRSGAVRPNPEYAGIDTIIIGGPNHWSDTENSDHKVSVTVKYNAEEPAIARQINFSLAKRQPRRELLTNISERIKKFQENCRCKLVIGDITPSNADRGLSLLENNIKAIQPAVEKIYLGFANVPLYEDQQKMALGINVLDSSDDMSAFLQQQAKYLSGAQNASNVSADKRVEWMSVQFFQQSREQLVAIENNIKAIAKQARIHCGEENEIKVGECLQTLRNVSDAISSTVVPAEVVGKLHNIVIINKSMYNFWTKSVSYTQSYDGLTNLYVALGTDWKTIADQILTQSEKAQQVSQK